MIPDSFFHPAVAAWFARSFTAPTPAQAKAWPVIQSRRDVLIAAPTGSGKTLAAFLAAINDLVEQGLAGTLTDETQVVYVSPLKALSNDVQRNLEVPLSGHLRRTLRQRACLRLKCAPGSAPAIHHLPSGKKCAGAPPHISLQRLNRFTSCWVPIPAAPCWRRRDRDRR